MIEINLLSEEFKPKVEQASTKANYLSYLVPLILGVLVLVHIYLLILGSMKSYQLQALKKEWSRLEPQGKALENLKKESEALSQNAISMQQLSERKIKWAEKMNKLSLDLPPGIWFTQIVISSKELVLNGSVVSLQKEEMAILNKFLSSLKSDKDFIKDFSKMELGSVQRRMVGSYDVMDFVITCPLIQR